MARQNVRTKGFKQAENTEMHQAFVGLRRSSAAAPHTTKARKGTRKDSKRAAIREFA